MFTGACLLFYNGHLPLNLFFVASLHRLNTVGSLCGFLHQNKVRGAFCEKSVLGSEADLARYFFYCDAAESLDWCGFRENGFCKILFSKNLDTKILITNRLGGGDSGSPDRHVLGHDRAIRIAGAGSDVTRGLWKTITEAKLWTDIGNALYVLIAAGTQAR